MNKQRFGERLQAAVAENGPLCVGIDPHPGLLADWGLPDSASSLREFALRVVEASQGLAAAVKPQSAFFERHGSAGVAVLEETLAALRASGTLSILDVKRGDIGSTMSAYADATLRPGAPLEADAITVSPFLGYASLRPALDLVAEYGKGIYVLALTSNPSGPQVQHARPTESEIANLLPGNAEPSVAALIAAEVARSNAEEVTNHGITGWGSAGLVIGATVGDAVRRLDLDLGASAGATTVLAPGFGAQGAGPQEREKVFAEAAPRALVSVSRGVLSAGPNIADLRNSCEEWRKNYRFAE
ncbi:orotidine-5'-phosphate decarboxylase [Dermabacteraceae bacterium TAE3-ERU5]|nr:orotidine-5'-phosphate decarboxylase [Dermabacteraceae bacterium TAE3-ERU5]